MATTESRVVPLSETVSEVSLNDFREIIYRRRLILLVFVLMSIAVGGYFATRPRKYAGVGEIRIEPGTASMYRTSPLAMLSGDNADKIASETVIMQSRTLYLRVAKDIDLVNDPAFWGHKRISHQSLDNPIVRDRLYRMMKSEIKVVHSPKDEIITITASTISPVLSAKIVNTLINDYVEYLFQMRFGATKRSSSWLISQLDDLRQQLEHDQSSLVDLQGRLGIIGLDEKSSDYLLAQSLNDMTKAASDATVQRIVAEAKFRFLQNSDPNLIEGGVNLLTVGGTAPTNDLLPTLRTTQAQLASSYARLLEQFGPNYPEVKQQKAQLDEINAQTKAEQNRILNQAKISYNAAAANEHMTNEALTQKKNEAFSSSGDMTKYVILLHDYEAHRTLYEGLVQRLREAGITSGMEAGEIDIVDLADVPAIPSPPGPVVFLLSSTLLGLVFGCVLVIAIDAMDTRIVTQDQAELASSLTVLGLVPHLKHDGKAGSSHSSNIAALSPNSRYTEAIQTLRSAILLSRPGVSPQVILLSSAVPGEGKSMTSLNLATVLAQHHARVLLVDCDLRKGTLHEKLQIARSIGLGDVLTGQATLDSAIQDLPDQKGLFLLPGGTRPPDPAVLLGSEVMSKVIQLCKERFEFVVLDCPPILGLSDTLSLGRFSDATVLVARQNVSSRKAVRQTRKVLDLARIPILGLVLNDVDFDAEAYGYGYGYGGAYKNYYSGYYQDSKKESE